GGRIEAHHQRPRSPCRHGVHHYLARPGFVQSAAPGVDGPELWKRSGAVDPPPSTRATRDLAVFETAALGRTRRPHHREVYRRTEPTPSAVRRVVFHLIEPRRVALFCPKPRSLSLIASRPSWPAMYRAAYHRR